MSATHPSASVAATLSTRSEPRAIGRLAAQIAEVVAQLDGRGMPSAGSTAEWQCGVIDRPSNDARLQAAVVDCVASIEQCLELARATTEHDDLASHARDDLRRLARLLTVVDRADVPFVLRQLRRVLGRLDGADAPLAA